MFFLETFCYYCYFFMVNGLRTLDCTHVPFCKMRHWGIRSTQTNASHDNHPDGTPRSLLMLTRRLTYSTNQRQRRGRSSAVKEAELIQPQQNVTLMSDSLHAIFFKTQTSRSAASEASLVLRGGNEGFSCVAVWEEDQPFRLCGVAILHTQQAKA